MARKHTDGDRAARTREERAAAEEAELEAWVERTVAAAPPMPQSSIDTIARVLASVRDSKSKP